MNRRRLFILGNSLLSNTLMTLLSQNQTLAVLGCAATPAEALAMLKGQEVDALIVLGTDTHTTSRFCSVLSDYPELPVIRIDISQDHMQLITTQNLKAEPEALVALLSTLPRRS